LSPVFTAIGGGLPGSYRDLETTTQVYLEVN
jgi:hypothetical protein